MAVDTPGDVHWLNAMLTGVETRCVEWDNVEVQVREYKGKKYNYIICPPGCVKGDEDIRRKCGISYWENPSDAPREVIYDRKGEEHLPLPREE